MTREEVFERMTKVFSEVFDEEISLTEETTAADVDGWDSLTHITLISEIEDEFDIRFEMKDVTRMKNVGELADKILELQA